MQLNFLEQFAITIVITLLTELLTKVTNTIERNAIQAAITFLQSLLSTQAKKLSSPITPYNSPQGQIQVTPQVKFGTPTWKK